MKKEWKSFIQSLPLPVFFYYKEDLQAHFPEIKYPLPCILLVKNGKPGLLLSASEIKGLDLVQLKTAMKRKFESSFKLVE